MNAQSEKRFLVGTGSASGVTKLAETLHKTAALLTTWTRCGKANCHCTGGHRHGPYHALYWREGTVQRRRYVRAADVPTVRAILEKRREQRRAERLTLAMSMHSWRELRQWVTEYEARLREQREQS